jgi:hypothetical protein
VIYNFQNYDQPVPGLVFDKAGNLYGAHYSNGEKGRGAVFQLSPSQGGAWIVYRDLCNDPQTEFGVLCSFALFKQTAGTGRVAKLPSF